MVVVMVSVGFARRESAPRSVVPAWLPLMPASDIMPIAAAVSSMLMPKAWATGATYFIASPVSSTAAFVSAAVLASTSATCAASAASNPKPRSVLAAMSDATARSVPEDAARSSMPGIAAMISSTLKPALARFSMPSAASVALNAVLAPRSIACFSSAANSSAVAPEIACTRDICCSKLMPTLTAAPTSPEMAPLAATKAAPIPFKAFTPTEPSF